MTKELKKQAKAAAEAARVKAREEARARDEQIDALRRVRSSGGALSAEDVALLAADDARLTATYGAPRPHVKLTAAEDRALYEDMGGVLTPSGYLPR
jgi:hypothetical protein